MKLHSITLRNFRCFEKETFHFEPNLVVLFGGNGLGKTTVLDAIAIAIGSLSLSFDTLTGLEIDQQDVFSRYPQVGDSIKREPVHPAEISVDGRAFDQEATWARSLEYSSSEFCTIMEAKSLRDLATEAVNKVRDGAAVELPLVAYYRTRMYWSGQYEQLSLKLPKGQDGERPPLKGYRFDAKTAPRVADLASWSRPEPVSQLRGYKDALNASGDLDIVREWWAQSHVIRLDRVSRGLTYGPIEAVAEAVKSALNLRAAPRFDMQLNDIVLDIGKGKEELHPLWELSDGYRHIVAMVADIARRLAMLNPHLNEKAAQKGTGVVLIDEIGQHLHPSWQQHILPDLMRTFPGIQFVVSTHSDQVLTSVKAKHIIGLRKEGDQIKPDDVDEMETLGATSERVAKIVMDVEPRPPTPDVLKLWEYKKLVYARKGDSEAAVALRSDLASSDLKDDPELVGIDFEKERQRLTRKPVEGKAK